MWTSRLTHRQVQRLLQHDERQRGDRDADEEAPAPAHRLSTRRPPISGPLTVAIAKTAPM